MENTYGLTVEARVRDIAAALGIPEFVYRVPLVSKASGVREVGDGLLLCGGGGAVLQVKARSRRAGLRDSEEDSRNWVLKHVARAARQGRGSKRTISLSQANQKPLIAIPARPLLLEETTPLQVHLDADCSGWPIIVVIDHPKNPTVTLPCYDDAFCISLNDWQELNRHLRSIHALLRYIRHVLESGMNVGVPLGCEFHRFESLATYEASQTKDVITETSFAAAFDPGAIAVYRQLLEKTWGPNDPMPLVRIEDYRPVLDYLDDVPAAVQAYVGRWILDRHELLNRTGKLASGTVLLGDRPLIYMCASIQSWRDKQSWLGDLLGLTALRASEWRKQMNSKQSVLGIGVRVMGLSREYSYVLVHDGRIPADLSRIFEWRFGVANYRIFQTRPLRIGRNERCPCGGGRKYKYCHGRNEK